METKISESLDKKFPCHKDRDSPYNLSDKVFNALRTDTSTRSIQSVRSDGGINKISNDINALDTPVLCNSLGGVKVFYASSASLFTGLTILKPLGKGSFAKVWLVQDSVTKQQLAAKLLQPQSFPNPEVVAKLFAKEIANLASSQCLGVVKFHRMIVGKEGLLLLQEYATAGNLWQHKAQDVFGIFIQIVQALLHLRDVQVVHRDLKPTNIFMCSNERLVIGDFGWSDMLQNLTGHTNRNLINNENLKYYKEVVQIMEKYLDVKVETKQANSDKKTQEWPGTFEINPPEVLLNCGPYSEKIDNYALGMIFLMLLTGRFICRPKNKEVNSIVKGLMATLKALRTPQPNRSFKVSRASWDLFLGLTDPDANARFSLEDVLNHPWTRHKFSRFCPNKWTIWHPMVRMAWMNSAPILPLNLPLKIPTETSLNEEYKSTGRVDSARSSIEVGSCGDILEGYARRRSASITDELDVRRITASKSEGHDYISPQSSLGIHHNESKVVDSTKFTEIEPYISTTTSNVLPNYNCKLVNRQVPYKNHVHTHTLHDTQYTHVPTSRTLSVRNIHNV